MEGGGSAAAQITDDDKTTNTPVRGGSAPGGISKGCQPSRPIAVATPYKRQGKVPCGERCHHPTRTRYFRLCLSTGRPSLLRNVQCAAFRASSSVLGLAFLGVIVLGALFTNIPSLCNSVFQLITLRSPDQARPFHDEEMRRKKMRKESDDAWKRRRSQDRARAIETARTWPVPATAPSPPKADRIPSCAMSPTTRAESGSTWRPSKSRPRTGSY